MFKIEWTKQHTTILVYTCVTILLAVLLVLCFLFPGTFFSLLGGFLSAISPVLIGFAIAYILYPICRFFDQKALRFLNKKRKHPRLTRTFAVLLTFLIAAAVIALFVGMVVPQIRASYLDLEKQFSGYLQNAAAFLEGFLSTLSENGGLDAIENFIDVDVLLSSVENLMDRSFDLVGDFANTLVSYSSKIVVVVGKAIVSVVIAVYFLFRRERLLEAISRFADLLLPEKWNRGTRKWLAYTNKAFGSFLAAKFLNAILITLINFVVFGLCDIPYYPLIALITGITDMIPYFGPFLGAIPSAFIILIADPIKVLWFAVLVLVIQQIDGNFIGPKILGEKSGVDTLLILVAITISGGIWGIPGMFFGVPVFTVLLQACREFTDKRLIRKGLSTKLEDYRTKGGQSSEI